jgi:hypothetical protein
LNKSIVLILVIMYVYFNLPINIKTKIEPLIEGKYNALMRYGTNILPVNHTPIPNFDLDIKHINVQKILYLREEALKKGWLSSDSEDDVSASIRFNNEIIPVKIRLKGRLGDHWEDVEHLSFKVEVKGDRTIMGMKAFDIQPPETRSFINEWYLIELYKYCGLIGLRYNFISVSINGKPKKLYALEEKFDKHLIENNQRRDGIIFKINTDYVWKNFHSQGINQAFPFGELVPFQFSSLQKDPNKLAQLQLLINQFELFKTGKLKTSDLFDVKSLATFFALIDLMGYQHATALDNLRFYFNPITLKIEPIGHDNQEISPLTKRVNGLLGFEKIINKPSVFGELDSDNWYAAVFQDEVFYREYIQALSKNAQINFLDDFHKKIESELTHNEDVIQQYYPEYTFDKIEVVRANQLFIRKVLANSDIIYANLVTDNKKNIEIECSNVSKLPVEIHSIILNDSIYLPITKTVILQASNASKPVKTQNIKVDIPKSKNSLSKNLKFEYSILGSNVKLKNDIRLWPKPEISDINTSILRQLPNINCFRFITINEQKKEIVFKKGRYETSSDIVIPKNYSVIANGSFSLNLTKKAKIISYSPLNFKGTEDNPIQIYSSDSSSQGLFVLNTAKPSQFQYTIFSHLNNPQESFWQLSSAITFYQSPVNFDHCLFYKTHHGDDFLNIVKSDFNISNCVFNGSNADALDIDFGKGKITNTKFLYCGNDAIDASGSFLQLQDIKIMNVGDKGISGGEVSHITGSNIEITNAEISVAAKDDCKMSLSNIEVNKSKIGFTVYKKKTEYGYAQIFLKHAVLKEVGIEFLVEKKSFLSLDDFVLPDTSSNIESIFYGKQYGKSSK